jgi:predicted MPP superfamily phosphohydrolase
VDNVRLQPISRRRFMKHGMEWLLAAAGLAGVSAGYSFFGERRWIELRSQRVTLTRLPQAFRGLKLVQFSDVHLGHFYAAEDLRQAVELINAQKPDLICFTGDLVDRDGEMLADAVPVLRALSAPLGKFAVLGNHDYRAGAEEVRHALKTAGFAVLDNRHARLHRDGHSQVYTNRGLGTTILPFRLFCRPELTVLTLT